MDTTLFKGKYWDIVFVSWRQEFPGGCIISSKKESLSELTEDEWKELGQLEKELKNI